MKLLVFAGSLRADSCNKKFARVAARMAGADASFIDLKDYPMPVYDGDVETASGIPEGVARLGKEIAAADAIILSTPEYNGSIPGMLKNLIDWLSREKPVSLTGKHLLLLAASPGALGGVRSLWHTRVPFEVVGMHVYPNMMGLPGAYTAFDESGNLKDEKTAQRLQALITEFMAFAGR